MPAPPPRSRVTDALPDYDLLVRSPGRINVIGEHTDYTGGLVMPAAIDFSIWFAVRRTAQPEWRLRALDLGESAVLPLPVTGRTDRLWVDYLAGVGAQFQDRGHLLPGLEIAFGGDLPRGSGMSSSAALEGGMAFVLNELLGAGLGRPELAQLCRRSSNTFIGVPTGIMDQFASLNGSAEGPIVLNCDTLEFQPVVSHLEGYRFLLVNSLVTHELGSSEYPVRVRECAAALAAIRERFPAVEALSAATADQLAAVAAELPENVLRRARYVIGENQRVREAVVALERGSPTVLGDLLNATHAGLRDDFAVSCPEVDLLQATANEVDGVAGSRIMGGGFGGCTINLVREGAEDELRARLTRVYSAAYGKTPEFYPVRIRRGTEAVPASPRT